MRHGHCVDLLRVFCDKSQTTDCISAVAWCSLADTIADWSSWRLIVQCVNPIRFEIRAQWRILCHVEHRDEAFICDQQECVFVGGKRPWIVNSFCIAVSIVIVQASTLLLLNKQVWVSVLSP